MIMADGREIRVTELSNGQRVLSEEEQKERDPVYKQIRRKEIEKEIDKILSKLNISDEEREQRKRILMLIELGNEVME